MSTSRHPDLEPEASPEPAGLVAALKRRVRRRPTRIYQIEFFDAGGRGDLLAGEHGAVGSAEQSVISGAEDPWPEARAAAAKLLDPRLQRIVSAAARGWVVMRLK